MAIPSVGEVRTYLYLGFAILSIIALFIFSVLTLYEMLQPAPAPPSTPWSEVGNNTTQPVGSDVESDAVDVNASGLSEPLLP